jgi:hypothetical protein
MMSNFEKGIRKNVENIGVSEIVHKRDFAESD